MREIKWNPVNPDVQAAVLLKAGPSLRSVAPSPDPVNCPSLCPAAGELIGFTAGSRRTTSVLMDGDYPNIRALFPSRPPITQLFAPLRSAEAARRISLVAERNTPLRLKFTQGSVAVDAGRGDEAQLPRLCRRTCQVMTSPLRCTTPPTSRWFEGFRY